MKLFITGTFRSGSTLLALTLNAHSKLSVTYDSVHFMRFAYMKYGKDHILPEDALKLGKDLNDRLVDRFKKGFDIHEYNRQVKGLEKLTYSQLYDIVMRLYVNNENWGEKTVLEWRNSGDILEMFDDIFIVHCLRDPRDVLSSWKNETFAPGVDYLDAISNCYDSMKYAQLNKKKYKSRYILLKFEDMLIDPQKTMRKLCNNLKLKHESQMLDVSKFKNKVTSTKWMPNTAFKDKIKGISKAPIGRWKKHLPDEDLILCELVNGNFMRRLGYKLSSINLNIKNIYGAFCKLQQSPLAYNGILNIIHKDEGVQRNPLDQFDPNTWETDENLM